MMDLAQTKRRRRQYVLLGMVLLFAGVVGRVMGLLKHLYVMKVAQGPIAKLVTALWDVPGVSWLWHHASLNSSYPSGDGWSVYIILGLDHGVGHATAKVTGSRYITRGRRRPPRASRPIRPGAVISAPDHGGQLRQWPLTPCSPRYLAR